MREECYWLFFIPPVKGVGIADKARIKGTKAVGTAADVSKLVSQTKHVLRYDKIMPALQTVYSQVVNKSADYQHDPFVQKAMGRPF
ncbi:hypothetical protein EDD69_101204 [Thermolongibacillus altinsuensis]|uniref:Uncharacterized protein n=1 Tax=Thermolongibacillus altinsuensis TaxID=575256 RepID=A0A4R1QJC4_9BACL|nr:hypothetical protein EDD69_101204 [Thermolongibacillus altinsuensis]